MLVDDDGRLPRVPGTRGRLRLDVAVADLYADLRLAPLLQRLLAHSRGLLGTVAGSVSVVDVANGRYAKIAENGVPCQLGGSFSLDEGATGQAVARRAPVVIDDYSHLRVGHLPTGHPAGRGAAAAVPLWWRGDVIGVHVAFAGRRRRFTATEVDDLELLTQSVASALVRAGEQDPSVARLIRVRAGGVRAAVAEARPAPATPLTRREEQVLRLLAEGCSDREVAAR